MNRARRGGGRKFGLVISISFALLPFAFLFVVLDMECWSCMMG